MRGFAKRAVGTDASAGKHQAAVRRSSAWPSPVVPDATTHSPGALLQRKPNCACGGGCPRCQSRFPIQTKLAVSEPGDVYEQEADQIAERVMRMPAPLVLRSPAGGSTGYQAGTDAATKEPTQRKRHDGSHSSSLIPDNYVQGLGPGQPLDSATREFFEPRFGHDFDQVRLHLDDNAAESARAVNALAYAVGHHIIFGAGQFAPETSAGRSLLAHELAHVYQNSAGSTGPLVKRYEGYEHQALADEHLRSLLEFLRTPEGERWASAIGQDPHDLIVRILQDPQYVGRSIPFRPGTLPFAPGHEPMRLTPAQIVSLMGDFYERPEALANAPAREISRILSVMDQERLHTISASGAAQQYEEITGGRYLRLAQLNDTHFARLNKQEWRRLHERAIAEARQATGPGADN